VKVLKCYLLLSSSLLWILSLCHCQLYLIYHYSLVLSQIFRDTPLTGYCRIERRSSDCTLQFFEILKELLKKLL